MMAAQVTDRAHRYRAQNNAPDGPKVCAFCGSRKTIELDHIDGHESHNGPENLMWLCRSCNATKGIVLKRARMGKVTSRLNPSASGGAKTIGEWIAAVGSIQHPHKGDKYKGSNYGMPSPMTPSDAVAMIRATSQSKRQEFGAKLRRRKNPWPFSRPDARRTTPASGGIAHHMSRRPIAAAAKAVAASSGSYKGYVITKTVDGEFFSSLDPQSWYETKAQAQRAIDGYLKGRVNPAKTITLGDILDGNRKEIRRMVEEEEIGPAPLRASRIRSGEVARPSVWRHESGQYGVNDGFHRIAAMIAAGEKKFPVTIEGRDNPAAASADAFEEFHGFAPSEVVTVSKKIHHHEHLAAAGKLTHLDVWGIDGKGHHITGFKGAFLAFNEDKNQLFVEGGDQAVNLSDFGIRKEHELETLGQLTDIGYQTNKTHLGSEGGEAVYVHKFRTTNDNGKHVVVKIARYPDLIYDVPNEQLLFSGGSYEIIAEGIDK